MLLSCIRDKIHVTNQRRLSQCNKTDDSSGERNVTDTGAQIKHKQISNQTNKTDDVTTACS